MRWCRSRFALFAVVAVAAGIVFGAPIPAANAAATVDTETLLLWRGASTQPTGDTTFYVSVAALSGTARPTGSVVVQVDGADLPATDLKDVQDPGDDRPAAITADFVLHLGFGPHYFITKFAGGDTFKPSDDELGFATASMDGAVPEPSNDGQPVTYTFVVNVAPGARKPTGKVAFSDDDGHTSSPNDPELGNDLKATWIVAQRGLSGVRWTATANYPGDDFYLPLRASRAHNVNPAPPPPPGATTTSTRRVTTTTRRVTPTTTRRTGVTAALAPINPSSTTTPGLGVTTVTFGAFPTSPPVSNDLASGQSNNNDGPPIAVVVTTLLALGVLGGIAAFRRYRHSAVDWF